MSILIRIGTFYGGRSDLNGSCSPMMASKQLLSMGAALQALEAWWDTTFVLWAHVWHLITAPRDWGAETTHCTQAQSYIILGLLCARWGPPRKVHKTPSNRDHRNKYLKDHWVLELTLNWSGKGNCAIQGWIWTRNKIFLRVYFKMHILERSE